VHTCFNQAVAANRAPEAASDPNLQNIPIRTGSVGRSGARSWPSAACADLRGLFTDRAARPGASLGRSRAARSVHAEHRHSRSDRAQGLRRRQRPQRPRAPRRAKIINYALLYGKQAFTLAKDIGVSREEAQLFIDAYFAGFPSVRAFIDGLLEEARQSGTVKTMFGPPPAGARSQQPQRPGARRRRAPPRSTCPIQGTAADILKKAMIDVHAALPSVAGAAPA